MRVVESEPPAAGIVTARLSAVFLLCPALLSAQAIAGRVLDATDSAGVAGVRVEAAGRETRTDALGRFRLGVPPGRHDLTVRMLGYAAFSRIVEAAEGETVAADVFLVRVPRLLSTMVVHGQAVRVPSGFEDVYRRAQMGSGSLLTREQIDSLDPRDVAAVLNRMPALRVSANRESPTRLSTPRCSVMVPGANVNGLPVALYFNGVPLNRPESINEILDHLSPSSIQAIELYNGPSTVPPNFQPACAAVAIWTRAR